MQDLPFECLTVRELREALESFDDDLPVVSNVSYGDRLRTQQAIMVDEVDYVSLTPTAYSESGYKVIDTLDEDDDDIRAVSLNFGAIG